MSLVLAALAFPFLVAGCFERATVPPAASVKKVAPSKDIKLSLDENRLRLSDAVAYLPSSRLAASREFIVDNYDNLWLVRARKRIDRGRSAGVLIRYDTKLARRHEYSLPAAGPVFANPVLVDDGSGNIWIGGSSLLRFDKASELFTDFPLPGSFAQPAAAGIVSMARSGDGRLWLSRRGRSSLSVFDPKTSRFKEIPLPLGVWFPRRLFSNGQGRNIWVLAGPDQSRRGRAKAFGRLDVGSLTYTNLKVAPVGVGVEPDGDVVYSAPKKGRAGTPDQVLLKRLDDMLLISRPLGPQGGLAGVQDVYVGPSGNIWLVVAGGLKRITPGSPIVDSVIFGPTTRPVDLERGGLHEGNGRYVYGVAEDSDGNLWFSDVESGKMGVVRLAGPGNK